MRCDNQYCFFWLPDFGCEQNVDKYCPTKDRYEADHETKICPKCKIPCNSNGYCDKCKGHNHEMWMKGYNKAIKDFGIDVENHGKKSKSDGIIVND